MSSPVRGNAALRALVRQHGWSVIGPMTISIPRERVLHLGPRRIVVRGDVRINHPKGPFDPEALGATADRVADRAIAGLSRGALADGRRILTAPDDEEETLVVARDPFDRAAREARARLVAAWRALEAARTHARIESALGLRFYLASLDPGPRRLRYFVGPTNSGKTHAALEELRAARTGLYLAPLRLLALEVYERLTEAAVAISLVTGEERIRRDDETHLAATVEMLPRTRRFDVAVIDETQLLRDPQRGWAWTLAVAGVRAAEVIMCGSEEGLGAASRLAERIGASLEVRRFERKAPLVVDPPVTLPDLAPHDAIVVFSRRDVVDLQRFVAARGLSTAAIYGALSPGVRRAEAARFRAGEADVLVATDAIGMGLNLPIRRIVFGALTKWDQGGTRRLTEPEIRQIAGRAGRFGLHERGHVTTLGRMDGGVEAIARALADAGEDVPGPIWIAPTDEHLARLADELETDRLGELLAYFAARLLAGDDETLRVTDLTDTLIVADAIERDPAVLTLPLAARYAYARAPVRTEGAPLDVLRAWASAHALGDEIAGGEIFRIEERDELATLEERSRMLVLYRWLANRFPEVYTSAVRLDEVRETIDARIGDALRRRGTSRRARRLARAEAPANPDA